MGIGLAASCSLAKAKQTEASQHKESNEFIDDLPNSRNQHKTTKSLVLQNDPLLLEKEAPNVARAGALYSEVSSAHCSGAAVLLSGPKSATCTAVTKDVVNGQPLVCCSRNVQTSVQSEMHLMAQLRSPRRCCTIYDRFLEARAFRRLA